MDDPAAKSQTDEQGMCGTYLRRCVLSALAPPRPIPNRVVKQRSAKGTGEMTPWETRSMHLCNTFLFAACGTAR